MLIHIRNANIVKEGKMENRLNKYSSKLTQDEAQPASQAMLYGAGFTEEDLTKAQVGIASTGYEGNPCNMHLNGLASHVKRRCDQ